MKRITQRTVSDVTYSLDAESFFESLTERAKERLRSEKSARVYQDTYTKWLEFCRDMNINPLFFDAQHMPDFVYRYAKTQSTLLRMMSAMRKVAKVAALDFPDEPAFERMFTRLKMLDDLHVNRQTTRRPKTILLPDEVYSAIHCWEGDTLISMRNRALLRVLLYTGLRRFEAAKLEWANVNLDKGVLTVVEGKGRSDNEDDDETIPILKNETVADLYRWKRMLHEAYPGHRYMFPSFFRGDKIREAYMSGDAVRQIVKKTGKAIGKDFNPHDARRTIITAIIENDTIVNAQKIARHKQAATTMRYAQANEAEELRKRINLDY